HLLTFILPTEIFPADDISLFSIVRLWLARFYVLFVVVLFIKDRGKKIDDVIVGLATIWCVIAAFLLFAYFMLGADYTEIRHASILFVSSVLLAGAILTKLLHVKLWVPLIIVCGLFFFYSIYTLYPNLAKRGDWARVGAFIEENERENQPIIIFQTYDALILPYHYKGANRVFPDEKFFGFPDEDVAGSPNRYRKQIEFIISKIPDGADEIWLLTPENCALGKVCQPLEDFVEVNYSILMEKDFYKEKVRLLKKNPK
ncbi:MAG: hypothetical protein H7070_06675, partial [Saprospiraceae bacterium]|nr:hypothetical protein [Pyrinomonadaceae bacterium]